MDCLSYSSCILKIRSMKRALPLGISASLVSSVSSAHLEHTHLNVFRTRLVSDGEALYRTEKLMCFTRDLHR
jgi:hypothetical protein